VVAGTAGGTSCGNQPWQNGVGWAEHCRRDLLDHSIATCEAVASRLYPLPPCLPERLAQGQLTNTLACGLPPVGGFKLSWYRLDKLTSLAACCLLHLKTLEFHLK
jgi:hypothetical protein